MKGISKEDWKLFREKAPEWQERYMGKLIEEYVALLNSPGNPSERFWALDKRIRNDKRHPGVLLELNKSEAIFDIAGFIRRNVISIDDLAGFSDELIEAVKEIVTRKF